MYGAPNGSRGTRERLLCPQCASAVTSLFGSRGARIEVGQVPRLSDEPSAEQGQEASGSGAALWHQGAQGEEALTRSPRGRGGSAAEGSRGQPPLIRPTESTCRPSAAWELDYPRRGPGRNFTGIAARCNEDGREPFDVAGDTQFVPNAATLRGADHESACVDGRWQTDFLEIPLFPPGRLGEPRRGGERYVLARLLQPGPDGLNIASERGASISAPRATASRGRRRSPQRF